MNKHLLVRWVGWAMLAFAAVSTLAACSGGPPGITNAVMAKSTKADSKDAVDVTTAFPADQAVFHAVVTISNLPTGSKVKTVWTVVVAGDAAPPNTEITQTEIAADGSRNLDFTLTPNNGKLPPGKYKADIYLDGKLDRTLEFTVG